MSLIARIELVDSLVCFTYSHWLSDYSARSCNTGAWRSNASLTQVVSQLWTTDAVDEREKCFNGLVYVSFIFKHPPCERIPHRFQLTHPVIAPAVSSSTDL